MFRHYTDEDHEAVCDFLIELNQNDNSHINWNWARFEWMAEHPLFDKSLSSSIGLWLDSGRIVGAAIYDMYFGEAFCGALPGHGALYPQIVAYAERELKDEEGLAIAACDDRTDEIGALLTAGFKRVDQDETVMSLSLTEKFPVSLPAELTFQELDPAREPYAFQWLLWQGFDHGTDIGVFEREEKIVPQIRPHLDPYLSVAAVDESGDYVAYCCLWYSEKTDYAYVEPVCVVPRFRGRRVAKAVIREALNRARSRGAKKVFILSDMAFYQKLGFTPYKHFSFYRKANSNNDRR